MSDKDAHVKHHMTKARDHMARSVIARQELEAAVTAGLEAQTRPAAPAPVPPPPPPTEAT